jgi:hypothetical protein
MADEDTVLEEAMDNLKEAGQRIRATQSVMRSEGMTDGENHRDLLMRLCLVGAHATNDTSLATQSVLPHEGGPKV